MHPMVLRCPRCSELKYLGHAQVMGELVICPSCGEVLNVADAQQTAEDPERPPKERVERRQQP
jgi:hypothetical protein